MDMQYLNNDNMDCELIESSAKMSFHLDGENEIDAVLLSKMISDMAELTKLTAREVNPDAYLKMNVTAFRNGSFEIVYSAVCQVTKTIINNMPEIADLAAKVIGSVKGIFEIKKLLKDNREQSIKEEQDDYIIVESQNGKTVRVPKQSAIILNVVQADQLVTNISGYAREHNPDGGFSVGTDDKNDDDVYCSCEDIVGMSKTMPFTETVTCQRSRIEATMLIRKAVFEGTAKWGFDLNGKAIEASIEDDDFIQEFQRNGSVNKGDHIKATVEIYVDLDFKGLPIKGSEKYTVIKVYGGIIHSMEQMRL